MSDSWERIAELFAAASRLPTEERTSYLERACGSDRALLSELKSLLAHHDAPLTFLEQPALGASFSAGTPPAAGDDPLIGRRIGPFRIEAQIGAGGVGAVYRGSRQDGQFEQTVAIKIVHPWRSSPSVVERFRREWQALANVAHPHIARLIDAGISADGTPHLVLEYIEGRSIDEHCDLRRLTVRERLELFEKVARAVHFAHQRLVVHCDLKPGNIMVTESGTPKLLDFGIAKILTPEQPAATRTGPRMLTPDYASPEQIRGEPVSTASDVYSLGVLLYELLAGCRPYRFTTGSLGEIEVVMASSEPPRASAAITGEAGEESARLRRTTARRLRRQLAGELDTIVLGAMRPDPGRRYGSAEQLAEDVRRYLDGMPIVARPDSLAYRLRKALRRNPVASATAAALLLALVGGAAATAWQARVATQEADHAGIEAKSSHQLADVLVDAFLVVAADRSPAELEEVRHLLARHLERARRELRDQPHARANLIDALGRVYGHLGMYDEALACVEEARAIRVDEFGELSLEAALSAGSRGEIALQRGDFVAAKTDFEHALHLHRVLPEGVHTDVATAANNLAVALRRLGDIDGAAALHREALELRRRLHGPHDVSVAESLNNLGVLESSLRHFDAAEPLLREALEIRREMLGDNHPLVAQTLNNLALAVHESGRPAEAETMLRDAVTQYRSTPGTEPAALAMTVANLADNLRVQGDCASARTFAEEALELVRRQHGDRHPDTVHALMVLAGIESKLDAHEAAIARYAEAVAAARELYPAGHPRLCLMLCNYGVALLDGGRAAEAEPVLRETVELVRAGEPRNEFLLATALFGLGVAHVKQGHSAAAEPLLREAEELFRERSPERAAAAAAELRKVR